MPLSMPTGAKAVGAVGFMVVGWLLANAYVPHMPYEKPVGYLRELTGLIGIFTGWMVMGTSVGRGYLSAARSGWMTAIVLIFWALLAFSTWEMLLLAVKKHYEGPMEAFVAIFEIMLDRSLPLFSVDCILVFLIGGSIAGMLTEIAGRRWL